MAIAGAERGNRPTHRAKLEKLFLKIIFIYEGLENCLKTDKNYLKYRNG